MSILDTLLMLPHGMIERGVSLGINPYSWPVKVDAGQQLVTTEREDYATKPRPGSDQYFPGKRTG